MKKMKKKAWLLTVFFCAMIAAPQSPNNFGTALKLYNRTMYKNSLELLARNDNPNPKTNDLIGRNYFMLGDYKKASRFFDLAIEQEPRNSAYYLWAGRTYGRRAETSNFLTAPIYARRAHRYLEKALELDAENVEAMGDLLEYYLGTPELFGGGIEKAKDLANKISSTNAADGQHARALIAEKRKEFGVAETNLHHALELEPKQAGRIVDLTKFLLRRGRRAEAEKILLDGEMVLPNNPELIFERARTYLIDGFNRKAAAELLEKYLTMDLTPDDPPRSEAEKMLKNLRR